MGLGRSERSLSRRHLAIVSVLALALLEGLGLSSSACSGPVLAVDIDESPESGTLDATVTGDVIASDTPSSTIETRSISSPLDAEPGEDSPGDSSVQDSTASSDASDASAEAGDAMASDAVAMDVRPADGEVPDGLEADADAMSPPDASDGGADARDAIVVDLDTGGAETGATDSGTMDGAIDAPDAALYTIGGSIAGLQTSGSVSLTLMSMNVAVSSYLGTANGPFTFPQGLPNGAGYNVVVTGQSPDESCVVSNGSGTVNNAPVMTVTVQCSSVIQIMGVVDGLGVSQSVMVHNTDNNDSVTVTGLVTGPSPASFTLNANFGAGDSLSTHRVEHADGLRVLPLFHHGVGGRWQHAHLLLRNALDGSDRRARLGRNHDHQRDNHRRRHGRAVPVPADGNGPSHRRPTRAAGSRAERDALGRPGDASGRTCAVAYEPSTGSNGTVTAGLIYCGPALSVSVTMTSSGSPFSVTCTNGEPDAQPLTVATGTSGVFPTPIPAGQPYSVTCGAPGHACTPSVQMGTMPAVDLSLQVGCD